MIALCLLSTIIQAKKDCTIQNCKKKAGEAQASRFKDKDERKAAYNRRVACACMRNMLVNDYCITCEENGDEKKVPHYAAKFSKGLQHDQHGILTKEGQRSYKKLVKALNTGCQETYNSLSLAQDSVRKLVSPQGSATFSFMGEDSAMSKLPKFPTLSSKKAVAQLFEVYLNAIARDVKFNDYGTGQGTDKDNDGSSITAKAARVMNSFGTCYTGPVDTNGKVTPAVLFRGNNEGALIGPYVSQFLYLPLSIPFGGFPAEVGLDNLPHSVFYETQQKPIPSQKNFGISLEDFVAIQNGQVPVPYTFNDYDDSNKRYLSTARDIAGLVHFCYPFEVYYNAIRILSTYKFPFTPMSPYVNGTIKNEEAFANIGPVDASGLLGNAVQAAIKAAWAHKWRGNRVLRPEEFAGLVHYTKVSGENTYGLNKAVFRDHDGINVLNWVKRINEEQGASTYLMPLVYPEGSPQHPSYPAGHSTVAGACITVIKAIFDDQARIIDYVTPVKPDPADERNLIALSGEGEDTMTVGSELNKLASNISIGRNLGGVHYRADGDLGMKLGESIAITLLQDHAACLTEQTFTGFELTKLDGTRIRITGASVEVV